MMVSKESCFCRGGKNAGSMLNFKKVEERFIHANVKPKENQFKIHNKSKIQSQVTQVSTNASIFRSWPSPSPLFLLTPSAKHISRLFSCFLVGDWTTHLKNMMRIKLGHFPRDWVKIKRLKPPPRNVSFSHQLIHQHPNAAWSFCSSVCQNKWKHQVSG